jgi:hypothetical protein
MAHAQKPDFVFRRNGRVHSNRQEASVQSTTGSRGVHISGSNAGYTMFRGSVKSTGYTLRPPLSLSLPLPCIPVCHHISTGLYIHNTYLPTYIHTHTHTNTHTPTQAVTCTNTRVPPFRHIKVSFHDCRDIADHISPPCITSDVCSTEGRTLRGTC